MTKKIRDRVLARDGMKCVSCGYTSDLEIHHLTPRVLGGDDSMENLITLCSKCHMNRHIADRSDLIKEGQKKSIEDKRKYSPLVTKYDFYKALEDWMKNSDAPMSVEDVLDVFESIPTHGRYLIEEPCPQ